MRSAIVAPFYVKSVRPVAGAVGDEVTLLGFGFGATSGSVTFGSAPATVKSWSDRKIVCSAPKNAEGKVTVKLTCADATSPAPASFDYRPRVTLTRPATASPVRHGVAHAVTGYLKPHHAAGTYPVGIECFYKQQQPDGTYLWVLRKTVRAKAIDYQGYTKYATKIAFGLTGTWRIRAYHALDANNAATWSAYRSVTVK